MTDAPLKIGITCYPTAGGSGIVATELGKELARRGHSVHFITHAVPVRLREFEERIAFHPVEAENYPLFNHQPYALNLAAKMSEVIERESLDIMHVHYALPHAVSAYLAREIVRPRSVKVVTTLHGTDITLVGLQPSFFSVTKFSIEQSDGVTAVSDWLRDQTRSIFNVTSPIEVIHNFVDPERFRPAADQRRRRCYAEPDELVFMHASNFRAVKNAHRVVEVFHAVAAQVGARLLMVGEGPDVAPARELARELGIAAFAFDHKRYSNRAAHEAEVIATLENHAPDFVILAGYMRLLSSDFVARFRHRITNIHPSLLPSFPGVDAQRQAVEYGVKMAGCTVHLVDESLDGGPIIAQRAVPVLDGDTPEELASRILGKEHGAYVEALRKLCGGYRVEGRRVIFD